MEANTKDLVITDKEILSNGLPLGEVVTRLALAIVGLQNAFDDDGVNVNIREMVMETILASKRAQDISLITSILREHIDFFTSEECELIDDEDEQYELLLNLIIARGNLICELQWDSDVMSNTNWIRKIDTYYFISDGVEPLYGPFNSVDSALESCDTCCYISDAVTNIYIDKSVDTVDWVIIAEDGHTLMINSEEYMVDHQSLVKVSQDKEIPSYASDLSEEEAQKLEKLIEKFNNDPKYFRYIINGGNSRILENNNTSSDETAEERLISMAIHSRY